MSANYRKDPLDVTAVATGGTRVFAGARLMIDDDETGATAVDLHDLHEGPVSVKITAPKASGDAKLVVRFAIVPLLGNGAYVINLKLDHKSFSAPAEFEFSGNIGDTPGSFKRTLRLP